MIVTFAGELTGAVLIGNVALLPPPGMTTDAGTAATSGLLLASVTTNPPGGAIHPGMRATVPCTDVPPASVVDDTLNV